MSKLKHLPADADVKSIVAAVEQDGAVILDNVISEEFIAALREETDPYMDQTVPGFVLNPGFQYDCKNGFNLIFGNQNGCKHCLWQVCLEF